MTKRSPSLEAIADAGPASWSDAGIERTTGADRLSPEQPDHGLLWVTRGALTLERAGRLHEVRKGTVIAYRVGGGLSWSAVDGTHVRWCARDVGVGPGQVAPWTSELALDGPVPPTQRRRPAFLAATVAVAWLFAIGVAWCYDRAHAARIRTEIGTSEGSPSPDFAERLQQETARQVFIGRLGIAEIHRYSSARKLLLCADLPPAEELGVRLVAARQAADEVYELNPSLKAISVAFGSGPEDEPSSATGRYFAFPPGGGTLDLRWVPDPKAASLWPSAAASSSSRAPEGEVR